MKNQTQFTNAINGNTAIMFLYDYIGQAPKGVDSFIRGQWFAEEMYYHNQANREICVYINSPGGQIYSAFSIIQAILDCEADTHIVGMAASMAGVLAQFGKKRTMNDFAVGMIHPPSGTDGKLLEMARAQLKDCLMKKSKLKEKQITSMLADEAEDTWLDSSEMLSMGLVDEVIVTGKKKDVFQKINIKNFNSELLNVNESFKIYSDIVNSLTPPTTGDQKPPTPNDMDIKLVGAELGLENVTDETLVINKLKEVKTAAASVVDLTNKLNTSEAAKTAAETAKTTAETALATERKERATELIENAIIAGLIKDEVKTQYIELAVTNYSLAKQTLSGIQRPAVHNSVHNFLNGNQPGGAAAEVETYENLAKNNPKKLNEIAEKDPAKFDKLVADYQAQSKSK